MDFQYHYNLHGSERKPLVEAISQILGQPAVYQGAPDFSYKIGDYTVSRDGVLSYNGNAHPELMATLVEGLHGRGFVAEKIAANHVVGNTATEAPNAEEAAQGKVEANETAADRNMPDIVPGGNNPDKLTIEIPSMGFSPEARMNLEKIVASKATLLRQAVGTDNLSITELDGKIIFPWFTLHGLDGEADAYSRLITAICNMAKNQKRVTATEKPEENAKYAMRLFLIRLGFIGNEYKTARKILLRNLVGNSSWKNGCSPMHEARDTVISNTQQLMETPVEAPPEPLPDGGQNHPPITPPVQYALKKPGGEPDEE